MKKGDKVKIDVNAIELDQKKFKNSHLGTGLSPNHIFFSFSLHDEILKRIKLGQNPTIESIVKPRRGDQYVNLVFDDGFKCGVDIEKISKI